MLIVINKITFRSGHFEKVIPLIRDNVKIGMDLNGCIEGHITRCVDNNNEIMVYSRWQSNEDYEAAKKILKKDSRTKKLMFQFLPHVTNYETMVYEILPFSL